MNNKKSILILAAAFAAVVAVFIIFFLPTGTKEPEEGTEVISKRVKIDLQGEGQTPGIDETGAPASPVTGEGVPVAPEAQTAVTEPITPQETSTVAITEPVKAAESVKKAVPAAAPKETPVKAAVKEEPKKEEVRKEAPKKVVAEAEPKPKAVKVKKASSPTAGKPWAINVASFPDVKEAQKLKISLEYAGYKSYITEFTKEDVKWFRVRVGFYRTKDDAAKAGNAIRAKFRVDTPWIVKPAKGEAAGIE